LHAGRADLKTQLTDDLGTRVTPSDQVFTFPRGGRLTIADSAVTPTSVVVLQYVGDRRAQPRLLSVGDGEFTAIGVSGRPFRDVIFN
jgi:hypothetical protein